MVNISKAEFLRSKEKGGIFNISVTYQGDELTPISIFYNLRGKNRFLLESAFHKESKGRYSYLGMDPYMKIFSEGNYVTTINKNGTVMKYTKNVLEVLKENIKLPYQNVEESGLVGGAVGYLGYDAIRNFEKIPNKNREEINVPESFFNLYKIIICYDHLKHLLKISYNVFPEDESHYEEIIRNIEGIYDNLKTVQPIHCLAESKKDKKYDCNVTKEEYESMVDKAKDYIKNGDIFQVVLSQRFSVETAEEPFEVYRRLRSVNPSPYLFYIEFDSFTVVGSSPESLVKVNGRVVETNPIAGTRPRGKNAAEDARLKAELMADEKERAEHLMLVDLGRNDIGKVSIFGTVNVKRFMEVDFYSHVMHIVSTVTGELRKDKDAFDSLASCFPAGTVSGAPKIRAMEIIDELENVRRGVYSGAIGFFSFSGDMDTCIAIRTIVFKDKKAYIQAGAGIVFDSVNSVEHQESLNKLGALREVI